MSTLDKKTGGKAPAKSTPSQSDSRKSKKRPFAKDGAFSISKVKHNIRRIVKTNDRFSSIMPRPQLSDASLNVIATIAIDMAKKISDTACECAKKVNKQTIGCDDVVTAVGIELKGELMAHCLNYIKEALAKSNPKK